MDYKYENENPQSRSLPEFAQHADLFEHFKATPIAIEGNMLKVAFDAPYDFGVIEQIEFLTGYTISPITKEKSQEQVDTVDETIPLPEKDTKPKKIATEDFEKQGATVSEKTEVSEAEANTTKATKEKKSAATAKQKTKSENLAPKKKPIFIPKEESLSKLSKAKVAVSLAKNTSSAFKEAIKAFCLNGIEQGILYRGTQADLNPLIHWQLAGNQSMFYRSSGLELYKLEGIFDLFWELEEDTWMTYKKVDVQPHRVAQFFVSQFKEHNHITYYGFQVQNQTFLLVGASKEEVRHLDKLQQIIVEIKNQQNKGVAATPTLEASFS